MKSQEKDKGSLNEKVEKRKVSVGEGLWREERERIESKEFVWIMCPSRPSPFYVPIPKWKVLGIRDFFSVRFILELGSCILMIRMSLFSPENAKQSKREFGRRSRR